MAVILVMAAQGIAGFLFCRRKRGNKRGVIINDKEIEGENLLNVEI
jgi:hypothetical protein